MSKIVVLDGHIELCDCAGCKAYALEWYRAFHDEARGRLLPFEVKKCDAKGAEAAARWVKKEFGDRVELVEQKMESKLIENGPVYIPGPDPGDLSR